MKKLVIASAVVLASALSLTSCGDTNYCYQVTQTTTIGGVEASVTTYFWGTKNELKTYEQTLRDAIEGQDIVKIDIHSTRTQKSQSDCHKE